MFTITSILENVLKDVKGYKPVSIFLTFTLSIGIHPNNLLNQTTSIQNTDYSMLYSLGVPRNLGMQYAYKLIIFPPLTTIM